MTTFAKTEMNRIAEASEATARDSFIFATKAQMKKALEKGFVICNESVTDGNKIAWKTTPEGDAFIRETNPTGTETETETPAENAGATDGAKIIMGYEIKKLSDISAFENAKVGREGKYPFESLGVMEYFDVPATADNPTPWKSLQSTVSTASRRYAKVTGTKTGKSGKELNTYEFERRFKVIKATNENGEPVARVARVQ